MHPFIALADSETSAAAYEGSVLDELRRTVPFDVAFFATEGAPRAPTLRGFTRSPLAEDGPRKSGYARELAPVTAAALAGRGVAVDQDVIGARRIGACSYYRDIVVPFGGGHSLFAWLRLRGMIVGTVMLGRIGRTSRFLSTEIRRIEDVVGTIAVGRASFAHAAAGPGEGVLTVREREIVAYVRLGYQNRDIAEVCGTSPNTVRNQLARIYEKLGVANRAEAVAVTTR